MFVDLIPFCNLLRDPALINTLPAGSSTANQKAEYVLDHSFVAAPFKSFIVFHTDFLNAIAVADRPPCLSPFIATRAFPSGVLGPVLLVHGFVRLMVARRDRNPFGVSRYDLRVDGRLVGG